MEIAIVKYNAGNNRSVANALDRLGASAVVTNDPEELRSADKIIFPGVGEASSAMNYLRERELDVVITSLTQPVLSICLGMQLLCESSEENDTSCLGILPHRVKRFSGSGLKVPHMGWNTLTDIKSPLFDGVPSGSYFYFVHGFYVEKGTETTAAAEYGTEFSAAVQFRNFSAVQFHPEKSGEVGARILDNFLRQ